MSTRKAWRPGAGPGQRVGQLQVHGLADPRRASTRACTSSSPGRWTALGSPTSSPGATGLDVGVGRRVVRRALVVATGVSAQGRRKIPEYGPGRRRGGRLPGRPCLAVPARTGAQGPLIPRPRGRGAGRPVTPTPASAPRSGRSFPGPPGSAAAPRFARSITTRARPAPEPAGALISTMLRPDQQGGRSGPVPARHRRPEGPVPRGRRHAHPG